MDSTITYFHTFKLLRSKQTDCEIIPVEFREHAFDFGEKAEDDRRKLDTALKQCM
jgi:hypothetical protein